MIKKTSDVYLAAVYLTLGAKMVNVNRDDPRHQEFAFESPKVDTTSETPPVDKINLDDVEKQFINKSLVVNAWDFMESIRRMKSVVHSR